MITFPDIARALNGLFSHAEGPLKAYKELKEIKGIFTNKGSVIRLIKNFLIEPTIFVSKSVREEVPSKEHDAINDTIDLFCSFYIQAFKILTNVYDVDAKLAVDMLGTSGFDYDLGDAFEDLALKHAGLNSVSQDDIIARFNNKNFLSFGIGGLEDPRSSAYLGGLLADRTRQEVLEEAASFDNPSKGLKAPAQLKSRYADAVLNKQELEKENKRLAYEGSQHDLRQMRANQTIKAGGKDGEGRLGNVHNQALYGYQMRDFILTMVKGHNGKEAITIEIPITIKANLVFVKPEELINAMMPKHDDKSIFARWDKWRSSGIKFWKDLVWCSDLIREYKQNKLKDKEDIMGKITSSEIAGMTKGAMSGHIGYERFYNMYITTANDRLLIERYLRGKLDNPKFKENFLIKANGLLIMVLDPDWEIGQVFIKDINKPSNIKFDKMGKRKTKDGGINELFKALYAQQAPVF